MAVNADRSIPAATTILSLVIGWTIQVTNPVQFEKSLANVMGKGFEYGYECGPGKVVAGILKRVDKKAQMTNVEV